LVFASFAPTANIFLAFGTSDVFFVESTQFPDGCWNLLRGRFLANSRRRRSLKIWLAAAKTDEMRK
jgi:hypothetical protein